VPRIAYVSASAPAGDAQEQKVFQALLAGLQDYGYTPGQNLQLESRFPTDPIQAPQVVGDLLQSSWDVLLIGGPIATQAAKLATSIVPIVGIAIGDPVGTGLVQSLARPGGNLTVISVDSLETGDKLLELLRQIEPTVRRFGHLYSPENPAHVSLWLRLSALAPTLGLAALPAPVHTSGDIDDDFETAIANGAEALVVSPLFGSEGYTRIAALALSHGLVSLGVDSRYAAAGGLLSYGANFLAPFRRAGYYVDRILKGASPADLPVEVATTFDLVVNRTTATALGITIPPDVALQVTEWVS
jgi:putative ABC transport system substrate-binding protein